MTTQAALTSSNNLGQNAIENASRANKWLFLLYMVFIVGAAVLTYLLWKSGNTVQNAIVADANARIEEAKQKGAEAGEKASIADEAAGEANNRAGELEKGNLVLRAQVATLEMQAVEATKDLTVLQKAASDAKTSQQNVEIELAKQRDKAATAERNLLALQERVKPRRLSEEQKNALVRLLSSLPAIEPRITWVIGADDGQTFAHDFADVFERLGWKVPPDHMRMIMPKEPMSGLFMAVRSFNSIPPQVDEVGLSLERVGAPGAPSVSITDPQLPDGTFEIIIGTKP